MSGFKFAVTPDVVQLMEVGAERLFASESPMQSVSNYSIVSCCRVAPFHGSRVVFYGRPINGADEAAFELYRAVEGVTSPVTMFTFLPQ